LGAGAPAPWNRELLAHAVLYCKRLLYIGLAWAVKAKNLTDTIGYAMKTGCSGGGDPARSWCEYDRSMPRRAIGAPTRNGPAAYRRCIAATSYIAALQYWST
jgi:hypothetical protein